MAHAKLPDETVQEIIRLRRAGFSTREIGSKLKLHHSTVADKVKQFQPHGVKGEPPPGQPLDVVIDRTDIDGSVDILKLDRPATVEELMELANLDPIRWIPKYYKPNTWQGYYKLKDGNSHRKVQLYQSKVVFERIMCEDLENAILEFVRKHIKPLPKPTDSRKKSKNGYAVSWGLWDAHIGMYAWNSEVGADFDVDIAVNRILNSVDDMINELKMYPIKKIWMPVGNDFMHFDNARHTTSFGDHFLDTDTRYARVYLAALKALVYMIEQGLKHLCNDIEIIYVPGNHDVTSSFTLCAALAMRFHKDKRVKVDLGANPRKYRKHGGVLLGFDHGRDCKTQQYSMIFSTEAKDDWSSSTYREIQIGHKHQRWEKMYEGVIPTNGMLLRMNPTLCNVDIWHHKQGLIGEPVKSVEAWRYDEVAYRGSHVTWARDEKNTATKHTLMV